MTEQVKQADTSIKETELEQAGKDGLLPALAEFWAPWCGYCRAIAPAVERIAGEYSERITVKQINVDSRPDLAERYGIDTIPTLLLFGADGKSEPLIAPASQSDITDWLKAHGIR